MNNYPFIPFIPNRESIIRRMGAFKASFEADLERTLGECISKAQAAFTVRGRAEVFDLKHADEQTIEIEGYSVESRLLAKLLHASGSVYLMCATIPGQDINKINTAMENGEGLLALVLDAYASEYVDGALDVIMQRKNEALRRTGRSLTSKRFSAGYGDLDIRYQQVFYELLNMRDMGVNINDRYLLIPEKSVIAIAGVE